MRTLIMPFAVFDLQQWPRQQQSSSSLAPSPVCPAWRAASACPASLPPFLLFLRSREHNERGHHFKPPQLSEGPLHQGLRPVAAQACWPTTRPTYLLANVRPSVPPSARCILDLAPSVASRACQPFLRNMACSLLDRRRYRNDDDDAAVPVHPKTGLTHNLQWAAASPLLIRRLKFLTFAARGAAVFR